MVCNKCGKDKNEECFELRKSREVQFRRKSCKECQSAYLKNYFKTEEGLISKMYSHQKQNSKKRGHPKPAYSKAELQAWLSASEKFKLLFSLWKESGYVKDFTPSIDRIDDYKGYSFSNIQVTQLWINLKKANNDRVNGKNNKGSKAVDMLTKDGIFIQSFYSMKQAEREIGKAYAEHIAECCKGKALSHAGFKWRYSDDSK